MAEAREGYVNEWLIAAELNLRDAEVLCFYGGSNGNMIFHLRQALECGMKALLADAGTPPTHSFSKLKEYLREKGIDIDGEEEVKPHLKILNKITEDDLRYPYIDDFNAPTIPWTGIWRDEALEIWRAAKDMHEWIVKKATTRAA